MRIARTPTPLLTTRRVPNVQVARRLRPISVGGFDSGLCMFSFRGGFTNLSQLGIGNTPNAQVALGRKRLLGASNHLRRKGVSICCRPIGPKRIFRVSIFALGKANRRRVFVPSFTCRNFRRIRIRDSTPMILAGRDLAKLFVRATMRPMNSFSYSSPLLGGV